MYLLGIDLETTGFSKEKDGITEIGAILWDTDRKQPVQILSELIKTDVPVPAKITEITGITQNDVDEFGVPLENVLGRLTEMSKKVVAVVAHNAPFDFGFLEANNWATDLPIIDTMRDIDYPTKVKYREQTYIAAHANFINPFPHRACTDVLTMFKMVEYFGGFGKAIERLSLPVKTLRAIVSYENKDLAKKAGFKWETSLKQWRKTGRFDGNEDFGFEVREVK